ncbi:hypothetical protein LOD99_13549 [Oopsacas minuta]|uniref:Uncharacterized protein n=1 Tax=Oopsacas minuta TaxID=111878 RepID=A0AAV7KHJ5_9METZ|nr:hypothetical protein LOD99_13549 [Oopsacas minuta]
MEHMLVKSKYFDTEKWKKLSLEELSCSELKILLEKQNKLINNSKIINNLPDRGEKIRQYISTIEEAIQVRRNYEEAVQAFSELKIEENKSSLCSPLSTPTTNSPRVLSDNIDKEKLEKLKHKIASSPSPRSTQLLSTSDMQELIDRDKDRESRQREAEIKMGDFLGMFKVGNVKVTSVVEETDDIYIRDCALREEIKGNIYSDTDSEVSDQSKTSSVGDIGDDFSLLEDCLYENTQ